MSVSLVLLPPRSWKNFIAPTFVLSIDPQTGMAKGSARSIAGFDLHKALTACDEMLDHYGGHQAAAGMSLNSSHWRIYAVN